MNSLYLDPVVKFSQEKYANLDMLVDVYAMQAVWSSEKLATMLGYDIDEISDVSIRKILDLNPTEIMKIAITTFTGEPSVKKLITKTGDKVTGRANIHSFLYEKSPYIAVTDVELLDV